MRKVAKNQEKIEHLIIITPKVSEITQNHSRQLKIQK